MGPAVGAAALPPATPQQILAAPRGVRIVAAQILGGGGERGEK